MDSLKLHQLINYYPAIGMVIGAIVLAVGLVRSNGGISLFALRLMVFVALLTVIVVFTGEFASWDPTARTAAAGEALSSHKLMGTVAFAVTTLAGIAAFTAIRRTRHGGRNGRWALMAAFALSVAASVLLTTTVFRGRQVKWAATVFYSSVVERSLYRQTATNNPLISRSETEERRTLWHA